MRTYSVSYVIFCTMAVLVFLKALFWLGKYLNSSSRQVTITLFYRGAQRKIVRTHDDKAEIASKVEPIALAFFFCFPQLTCTSWMRSDSDAKNKLKGQMCAFFMLSFSIFLRWKESVTINSKPLSAGTLMHRVQAAVPLCAHARLSFSWWRARMLHSASRLPQQPCVCVRGKNLT